MNYAAIFVDYENIFYFVKNRLPSESDPTDAVVGLLRELQEQIRAQRQQRPIVQHAYADFENTPDGTMNALFLQGFEPQFVAGTDHKNAADMKLCIDAMSILYARDDVKTFYILAGDRDYIPVIRHLVEHAREVIIVAFPKQTSGDLRRIVGNEGFWDATTLVKPEILRQMVEPQPEPVPLYIDPAKRASSNKSESRLIDPDEAVHSDEPIRFEPEIVLEDQYAIVALEVLLERFGSKPEVWVGPFLRVLREELTELAEWERRGILDRFVANGIAAVQMRRGEPHDYSVLVLNWNHPDVQKLNPGR